MSRRGLSEHDPDRPGRERGELLRALEAPLGADFEAVGIGTFTWDARGGGTFDDFVALVHPDDRDLVVAAHRGALAAGEPFAVEHRLRHGDDGYRWIVSRGSPIAGREGVAAGLIGVCVYVHERRLERERERLLADVTEALDADWGTDRRLEVLAKLLVDRVGDVCVIEMPGEDGRLRRVAGAARDPELGALVADLRRRSPMPADDRRSLAAVGAGGAPVLVEEVGAEAIEAYIAAAGAPPDLADALRRRPPRSVIVAPLAARGRTLGGLMVLAYDDRRLAPADLAVVADVARRAGRSLDDARLVEETRSTAQRLRLLQAATAALSSASTPEEVAGVVATHSRILLGATSVSVYEVSGDGLAVIGRDNPALPGDERWLSVPLDAPLPVSDAARERSPVWIPGPAAWARAYPQLADEAARASVASAAALPLVGGGDVVGAIAASFAHERGFTEADRDLARALAEASGQALARARLQRDAESQRRRAELLAEASYALDTSSNVRDRLARLLALVVPDMADLATVRLADEAGPPMLAALAHVDAGVEELAWKVFGRGGGSRDRSGPARVVRTGRPELIADVGRAGAADAALRDALAPFAVRSYASVPLTARGSVIGALTLMTTAHSGRRYDRDDLGFAAELARRAALAVDNAGRYEGEQEARAAADRSRRRTERLQRVTAALAAALTEEEIAQAVVEEAMGALSAVAGAVVVREGNVGRVVVAAGYPPELLASGTTLPLDAPVPMASILRTGQELWLETSEHWTGLFGAPRPEFGAAGIGLPLRVGGEIVGAIGFRFGEDQRAFSPVDRDLVRAMAGQLAQAIERARLYESERRAAEVFQRSLLPASLPVSRAARVEVLYLPAGGGRSGGDFYDAIELPDGRLSLVVGDVVGHGTEAAAVMGQLRSAWRAFALAGAGPAAVAASLSGFAALLDGAAVATVACALLSGDELRYACAGHPPPLLRRPDGVAEYLDDGRGPPLATGARREAEGRVVVEPGALVLFYTDGVVERHRDIERGMAELAELVSGRLDDPGALLSRLAAQIGLEPEDDCALLALQVLERPRPLRIEIAADPSALREARAGIRAWLAESGVARAEAEDVVLAASEALANGVEHAYADAADTPGPVRLEMTWGPSGRLLVEVADRGRWRASGSAPAGRGRGLVLMRALMDSVDVDAGDDGTTVRLATTTGRAS